MEPTRQHPDPKDSGRTSPLDVMLGASGLTIGAARSLARRARPVLDPVVHVALDPPMLPGRLRPARWLASLARLGADQRVSSREDVSRLLDQLVPAVVEEVLQRADLTTMVARYVDLDGVVAQVDLDAAAKRIDVDAIVQRANLDDAAKRIDVNAIVRRADLDDAVSRVDIDAVAGRLDLDAVVRRLDFDAVLDRLDLTAVVLERVDLDALVQAVLERIDLPGLAEQVIDAVDLPEIIRESTGSMASDTVRGARAQGIAADEAVGRLRDRLLLRRGHGNDEPKRTAGAVDPAGSSEVPSQTARES